MTHKPNKQEIKQIENLNKAYLIIQKGLKVIKENIPKDDEVWTRAWRIEKEIDRIIKRIGKVLEKQYIDKEFTDIIKISKNKKGKRYNKSKTKKNRK